MILIEYEVHQAQIRSGCAVMQCLHGNGLLFVSVLRGDIARLTRCTSILTVRDVFCLCNLLAK